MINEIILMNGYGLYVWSSFLFTLFSFGSLFLVIKLQLFKEEKKFYKKFGSLSNSKAKIARSQNINKVILANTLKTKI